VYNKNNKTYINLSKVEKQYDDQGYIFDLIVEDDPMSGEPQIIAEIEYERKSRN